MTVDCAGAAANYWLVRWLLRDVVAGLAPRRLAAFAAEMQRHREHLLHYNLFIRTAPIFPRWARLLWVLREGGWVRMRATRSANARAPSEACR